MTEHQIDFRKQAQALLLRYGLRKTSCRTDVLKLFMQHDYALSHADLERKLDDEYDRVTLYRTLYSFKEQGLIHSIHDTNGIAKYALCKEACTLHKHQDNHVHFTCNQCGQTYCLNEVHIPVTVLPDGYNIESLHFSAKGVCQACNIA
jgi:Fur family transcriptional regulator, ferric uptake regulator